MYFLRNVNSKNGYSSHVCLEKFQSVQEWGTFLLTQVLSNGEVRAPRVYKTATLENVEVLKSSILFLVEP